MTDVLYRSCPLSTDSTIFVHQTFTLVINVDYFCLFSFQPIQQEGMPFQKDSRVRLLGFMKRKTELSVCIRAGVDITGAV